MSLTISDMCLAPTMARNAIALELAFPGLITWTSGRRTLHEQARAMATNHLLDPRAHLVQTYMHASDFLEALRKQPHADMVEEITEIFYTLMQADPSLVRSAHLLGNACDMRRLEESSGEPTPDGRRVVEWIQACPETADFRRREGKRRIWHWACVASATV